jgi:sec-independent protein translocase protein TatA
MNFGPTELIIILVIVLVLFGANRVSNLGGELGSAVKNFRRGLRDDEAAEKNDETEDNA